MGEKEGHVRSDEGESEGLGVHSLNIYTVTLCWAKMG